MLCQALEAVEDANSDSSTSSTSSESLGVMPEGMDTIRPRKVRVQAPNPTFDIDTYLSLFDNIKIEKGFSINVYFFDNFLDGNPYLYALKENENVFKCTLCAKENSC